MHPYRNPFAPGAGTQPPELVGRQVVLDRGKLLLERLVRSRPEKSFIAVGLRGVGKTVVLNKIRDIADEMRVISVQIEAIEDRNLVQLLVPKLRQALLKINTGQAVITEVVRALRVMASFVQFSATVEGVEFGMSIDPEAGVADTGNLELDLPDLFEAVGEAARARQTAICLIIDELQYASEPEMSSLIMAMHRISQRNLPVALVGGGLPQIVGLAGKAKSYAERLFDYPRLERLNDSDAMEAIREPVNREGAAIEAAALARIVESTQGYPYFLQEWGYQAWNIADGDVITADIMDRVNEQATQRLDESFFRVRFDRLTPVEQRYMFAMAGLGAGPHRSGDVAAQMGRDVQSVAPHRSSLIRKGMIFSPAHGDTAFTVPMFDQYLNRAASGNAKGQPRLL